MSTKPIKLKDLQVFDPADHLQSEESIQGFLADAEQEPDPRWMPIALAHVARARERWNLPGPGVTGGSMAESAARPDDIDAPLPDDEQHAVDGVLPPPTTARGHDRSNG